MLLSSSTASTASPGSPSSANPGALRRGLASAALPRPPLPPAASTNRVPAPIRSATISPSTQTTVPSGTRSTRSSPRAPLRLLPAPGRPLPAFWCGRWWKSSRVCTLGSTSRTTSPPSPPLPPSGPPSGLYFSRWTEDTPCPPLPAATCTVTRSTNAATSAASCLVRRKTQTPRRRDDAGVPAGRRRGLQTSTAVIDTVLRPRRVPKVTAPGSSVNSVSSPPRPTPRPGWKCVPRCRTMISPAFTTWPPKRLTPSRCALESRPLREDEAPFLCAMSASALRDVADHDVGEALTVPLTLVVAGLVLELVDVDLRTLAVPDDLTGHGHVGQGRGVAGDGVAVDQEQGREGDGVARLTSETVDREPIADSHLVLTATGLHDCVHHSLLVRFTRCPALVSRAHDGLADAGAGRVALACTAAPVGAQPGRCNPTSVPEQRAPGRPRPRCRVPPRAGERWGHRGRCSGRGPGRAARRPAPARPRQGRDLRRLLRHHGLGGRLGPRLGDRLGRRLLGSRFLDGDRLCDGDRLRGDGLRGDGLHGDGLRGSRLLDGGGLRFGVVAGRGEHGGVLGGPLLPRLPAVAPAPVAPAATGTAGLGVLVGGGGRRLGGRLDLDHGRLPPAAGAVARALVPLAAGVAPAVATATAATVAPAAAAPLVHRVDLHDHTPAAAVLARLGEDLEQALADPLAGHLHQAQRGDLRDLVLGAVTAQALGEPAQHQVAVALQDHVDEVDDDDPADVTQPELADDLLGRLHVV